MKFDLQPSIGQMVLVMTSSGVEAPGLIRHLHSPFCVDLIVPQGAGAGAYSLPKVTHSGPETGEMPSAINAPTWRWRPLDIAIQTMVLESQKVRVLRVDPVAPASPALVDQLNAEIAKLAKEKAEAEAEIVRVQGLWTADAEKYQEAANRLMSEKSTLDSALCKASVTIHGPGGMRELKEENEKIRKEKCDLSDANYLLREENAGLRRDIESLVKEQEELKKSYNTLLGVSKDREKAFGELTKSLESVNFQLDGTREDSNLAHVQNRTLRLDVEALKKSLCDIAALVGIIITGGSGDPVPLGRDVLAFVKTSREYKEREYQAACKILNALGFQHKHNDVKGDHWVHPTIKFPL